MLDLDKIRHKLSRLVTRLTGWYPNHVFRDYAELHNEYVDLDEKVTKLTKENKRLKAKLEKLK
jgi:hypothetical protein